VQTDCGVLLKLSRVLDSLDHADFPQRLVSLSTFSPAAEALPSPPYRRGTYFSMSIPLIVRSRPIRTLRYFSHPWRSFPLRPGSSLSSPLGPAPCWKRCDLGGGVAGPAPKGTSVHPGSMKSLLTFWYLLLLYFPSFFGQSLASSDALRLLPRTSFGNPTPLVHDAFFPPPPVETWWHFISPKPTACAYVFPFPSRRLSRSPLAFSVSFPGAKALFEPEQLARLLRFAQRPLISLDPLVNTLAPHC